MKRRKLETQLVVKLFPSVPKGIWLSSRLTRYLEKRVFYREFSVSFGKAAFFAGAVILLCAWSIVALVVNVQSAMEARAYKQEAGRTAIALRHAQRDFVTLYARLGPIERKMLQMDRISTGIATVLGVDFGQAEMPDPEKEAALVDVETALQVLGARFDTLGTYWKDQEYELAHTPSIAPLKDKFWVTSRFGYRRNPWLAQGGPEGAGRQFHSALDLASDPGTAVHATADGVVEFAGQVSPKVSLQLSLYGNYLILDHGNGFKTAYAHLQDVKAQKGQQVRRGDVVAWVGDTGRSTGPHLHYEILLNNQPLDPEFYVLDRDLRNRQGVVSRLDLGQTSELYDEYEKLSR